MYICMCIRFEFLTMTNVTIMITDSIAMDLDLQSHSEFP